MRNRFFGEIGAVIVRADVSCYWLFVCDVLAQDIRHRNYADGLAGITLLFDDNKAMESVPCHEADGIG